jgi:ribosomal protein S20
MTFEEMQLILQQVVVSQRETQEIAERSQRELQEFKAEVRTIVRNNDRTIQAMLDQAATDRLRQEEDKIHHQERMDRLERISEGMVNMLASIDEDRPTILKKLNTLDNKADAIIERLDRK